ncbi:MAG: hypothetical protein AAFV86_11525 [Pseudomonadota bacterium]
MQALSIDRSVLILREAAGDRRFISYGEFALGHGLTWSAPTRTIVFRHLDELNHWSSDHGLPLLSVIVTNKENLKTGRMAEKTLAGFVDKARRLHHRTVDDPQAFVASEQQRVFEWAGTA